MAVTITPLGGLNGEFRVITDADCDATPENDVADGGATIYGVVIDNSANAALTYVHFFDSVSPTVGTTAPDMVLPANASDRAVYLFEGGVDKFSTAITYLAKTVGGTAGSTGPTSNVPVTLVVR